MDEGNDPPLFDDPQFLAELADLDQGLTTPRRAAATRPAARFESAPSRPASSPPAAAPRRRRALIDLFPPVGPAAEAPSGPTGEPAVYGAPRASDLAAADSAAPYETFYGFSQRPFAIEPDTRFLYRTPSHDRAVQAVTDAIATGQPVSLVIGELGFGKTLLCRVLAQQLDGRRLVSVLTAPIAARDALVRQLLVDFGVAAPDDVVHVSGASARETLESFLGSLSRVGAVAVVVIDDAHRLSAQVLAELEMLLAADATRRVLRIVLVGERELLATARTGLPQLESHVAVGSTLDPLSAGETAEYIAHRLAIAGRPRIDVDDEAVRAVSEFSGGNPALVNAICDRALAMAAERASSTIDAGCVTRAAEEIGLVTADARMPRLVPAGAAVVLLSVLVVGGSLGSAYVFRDRVRNGVIAWQSVPSAPAAPALRQPAPLGPLPVPSDL